jgi:hypothetical protein
MGARRDSVHPKKDREYPELGIRSFGKGTFHKPLDYLSVGTKRLFRIEPGDLVFSNVFAWEGAIAVAQKDDEGRLVPTGLSHAFREMESSHQNFFVFIFYPEKDYKR